jgi:hypothetical protein
VSPGNQAIDKLCEEVRKRRERRQHLASLNHLERMAEALDSDLPPVVAETYPDTGPTPGGSYRPLKRRTGLLDALWRLLKPSVGSSSLL